MLNLNDLLSLAQGKVSNSYEKISDSYDNGLSRVAQSLGLRRKQEEEKSDVAMLAGLFSAGLVTGVALSLLFAPKSGSELRRSVRRALPTNCECEDDDDYELPSYDFGDDRFRSIRRPRRSHRGRY